MTKPKQRSEEAALATVLRQELRTAVTEQLRIGGPQTAAAVHAAIGGDFEVVRARLYRLAKTGAAKSERIDGNSVFRLGEQTPVARNVAKPHRPVLKEWTPNTVRDPLVCFLFGAPDVRAAA